MIDKHIEELQETLQRTSALIPTVTAFATALFDAFTAGNKLLTCGNGGSSAEAGHFAEEFTGRFWRERRSLPGVCMSIDGMTLTCIGNDYGFDEVFARQVQGYGRPGDVLAAFSSSGNSENVIRALKAARDQGLITASFCGKGGGRSLGMADYELIVPSDSTMRVQETHLFLLHMVCELVERRVLGLPVTNP